MTGKRSQSNRNAEPVYLQTYKQILREIQEKRWNPGDKLPADMVFAKELGINHLTLKKALNRLASEGFLLRTPGRGTFVAEKLPVIPSAAIGKRVAVIYDMVREESFHGDIFLSIYKAVGELGLTLELLSANNSRTTQFKQIMSLFSDPDSAGCIVWSIMDMRQLENLAAAKPENYPLIFINHDCQRCFKIERIVVVVVTNCVRRRIFIDAYRHGINVNVLCGNAVVYGIALTVYCGNGVLDSNFFTVLSEVFVDCNRVNVAVIGGF